MSNFTRDQLSKTFTDQRQLVQFENLNKEIEAAAANLVDLNAQISALQASLTAAEGDITTLQSDISTAQSDISSIQSDISTAQSDINALQTDVANLEVSDLVDVSADSPSDNDMLKFVTANSRWEKTNQIDGQITDTSTNLISSNINLTNGAGASTATLTNAPSTGDPAKWVPIDDNGTTRYIPTW